MTEDKAGIDTSEYHKELKNLKADLAALRGDMSSLLGSVMDLTKQGAGAVKDKAREKADAGLEKLHDVYNTVRKEGGEVCDKMHQKVEENPVSSVLIALGAGLLIGRMFFNGHRE